MSEPVRLRTRQLWSAEDVPVTPTQLADELDIDPKRLRRWLRSQWTGPGQGGAWDLTPEQVSLARQHFAGTAARPAERPREPDAAAPTVDVETLATWSSWVPFSTALEQAARRPGVYMARGLDTLTVYVGMAGERRGDGLRGRLRLYLTGKAAVSGLGEACLDRALADAAWVQDRLAEVTAGAPRRAKDWARLAVERADLQVRWATTTDRDAARRLERQVLTALRDEALWNRLR